VKKWVIFLGQAKPKAMALGAICWRKGRGARRMTRIGLPVPAGFTISTEACDFFYKHGKKYPPELRKQVADNIARLSASQRKNSAIQETLFSSASAPARALHARHDGNHLESRVNDRSVAGPRRSHEK